VTPAGRRQQASRCERGVYGKTARQQFDWSPGYVEGLEAPLTDAGGGVFETG